MTAQIIDGVKIAEKVRNRVKEEVANWVADGHSAPGLATVLVGENPASQVYVRSKQKACGEAGIQSFGFNLPATSTQEEVEALVRQLNADPKVNGILVQLPLPAGLDEERVLREIKIEKDVDGFHPLNIGRLAQKGRDPLFIPCTPYGCMVLLEEAGVKLSGAKGSSSGQVEYCRYACCASAGPGGCDCDHLPFPDKRPASCSS